MPHKPAGEGAELVPISRVTGLVGGDPAAFQLLLDGKSAAGLKVIVIAAATRHRNAPQELTVLTGKDGKLEMNWPHPVMHLINASTQDHKSPVKQASERLPSSTATVEVLPE